MNILIFSQHFWPEIFRINETAKELSKKNNVYVVSSWPNYNYKNNSNLFKYGFENYKKVKILRVPTIKRNGGNYFKIIFNYLSYIFGAIFIKNKFIQNNKFDAIICYATSPIYQVIPAIIFSKKHKVPLFLWVQDLWPEVLKDLDVVKNKFILNILRKSVNFLYTKCDFLLAQSLDIKKILDKSFKNTFLAYNPSNITKFKKFKLSSKKNKKIVFAGNVGKAQNLEKLINYGKIIKKNNFNINFEIIGEGSSKKKLVNLVKNENLKKIIHFKKNMSLKKLEKYLYDADGLLVALGKGEALSVTIPAKFQTYLPYGKPIFCFPNNILENIIKKNNLGFILKDSNFKEVIYKFIKMPKTMKKKINNNCKNLFIKKFELKKNTHNLETFIRKKIIK